MIQNQLSDFILDFQKSDELNLKCMDCNADDPSWTSINNGIFLCLSCAGKHRSLGVNFSYVQSINMDEWTESNYKLFLCGGNRKLKNLLEEYKIPPDLDIQKKYKLKLLEYYRQLLYNTAHNELPPEKLNKEEALEYIDNIKTNNEINDLNNEHFITNFMPKVKKKKNKGLMKSIKNFWNKSKDTINKLQLGNKAINALSSEIYKEKIRSNNDEVISEFTKINDNMKKNPYLQNCKNIQVTGGSYISVIILGNIPDKYKEIFLTKK